MYENELKIIEDMFDEEDIEFNKKMVGLASNIGKKRIKHVDRPDVVEDILTDFRKKWGLKLNGGD